MITVHETQNLPGGETVEKRVECGVDEDLLAYDTDGFYRIGPYVLSGHDIGCLQRVAWSPADQEWKDVRP